MTQPSSDHMWPNWSDLWRSQTQLKNFHLLKFSGASTNDISPKPSSPPMASTSQKLKHFPLSIYSSASTSIRSRISALLFPSKNTFRWPVHMSTTTSLALILWVKLQRSSLHLRIGKNIAPAWLHTTQTTSTCNVTTAGNGSMISALENLTSTRTSSASHASLLIKTSDFHDATILFHELIILFHQKPQIE